MDNDTLAIAKFITFKVADYWFALPMEAVLKVVNCPSRDQGGIVSLGIVQLSIHTIQLLDLHGVFGLGTTSPPRQLPFLLVLRDANNKLWGITLESPPDLMELPLATFHSVTVDRRFIPKKQWISHIAIPSEQDGRTLLLLDLQAVFRHETKQPVVATSTG
ncbi:chemotaxis protein CheW [Leptolyngbya cf. ectocarpi LEGE 11479]|uniref:Chemotaxis protein CheW n=1 Tax=Leptolyngbya cf. ectocarpi LEGE 11479 TaxID=1828722 RepID=A0A928ZS88_LEPEC|nr:chemotaxis protein CheW [Leptolyngbya ectocarpi]MBE9065817.1 chemotaxis protein CheW [Leptolyngbya cf. ectocarpi LEGE 11479]